MKKILILFLLSFPIIIFTVVTLTSSVIAYYVPLAVEGIEIIKGVDISDNQINQKHELEFQIYPKNARNMSFEVRDEYDNLIVDYNQGGLITINNLAESIIEIKSDDIFIKDGLVSLDVITKNIGFTKLTIITKDGNYRVSSDVMVLDKDIDPTIIQGVVFDYNETTKNYKFGNKNKIEVGFTYFPKTAIKESNEDEINTINEKLKQNALKLDFVATRGRLTNLKITEYGRGTITIEPNSNTYQGVMSIEIILDKKTSFDFNIKNGYNIVREDELFTYKDLGANLYLLDHIDLTNLITFNNGVNIYGNNFKIDHSQLKEYEDIDSNGKIKHIGKKAITLRGNNSGLHDVHIIGALDENSQPYENITNVQMDANGSKDKLMYVNNVIIENGRYNLSVRGKIVSNDDEPTIFNLDNIKLVGAFIASLEIDNHSYALTSFVSTVVNLSRLNISYTAIGILLQNNRNSNPASKLNLIKKDNINAITSTSWRNLDDASGALSATNFGYILRELKSDKYKDVYFKDGKDYYVNPVIMLRGGGRNRSEIDFNSDDTINLLIRKERKPKGMLEVGIVGGTYPFLIYLLDPNEYERLTI